MYTLYRNRCQELKKLTQTAKEEIARAKRTAQGRLELRGTLLENIRSAMLTETEEQPAEYQFWTFIIGSILLFVFGIVNLLC